MAARSSAAQADPTAFTTVGGLEVVAKLLDEGDMFGQHKSLFEGSSFEHP